MTTDLEALQARVDALEHDRNGLEWLVTFLAAKTLLREPNPIASAEALQREVEDHTQAMVNHALQTLDHEKSHRVVRWASNSQIPTDQIVEEVRIAMGS